MLITRLKSSRSSSDQRLARTKRAIKAFTLIELLVVLGVIAVLIAIGGRIFQGSPGTLSVHGASDTGVALIELARNAALNEQTGARIVIDADPQSSHYLHRMTVVRRTFDGKWNLDSQPYILPAGVYIYPKFIAGNHEALFDFRTGTFDTGGTVWYFEFDGTGNLRLPEGATSSQVVFVSGILSSQAPHELFVPEKNEAGKQGFILRRTGVVSRFESVDQIKE